MKKKAIFLMLALIMMSAASVNAQVTIGSMNDPHKGAILDMSQSESGFGVLFPKVYLFNTKEFSLPVDEGIDAKGMMVYNSNASLPCGLGFYAWNGSEWKSLNAGNASCVPVTAAATSLKTGNNAKITITVTAGNPAFSYTWSKDGNSIRTATNVSAASDSYTTAGAGIYTVTVTNPCTATPVSFTFEVKSDGETLVDNGNGTKTDSQGNLVYKGETYSPIKSDIPGFYLNEENEVVYPGKDGIPGTEDDDIYVIANEPLPTQNTIASVLYPVMTDLRSDTTYQLSLDYADPIEAGNRKVIKYLTSDPALLTISESGLITAGTVPASYTSVNILILLDDGSVIAKTYNLMLPSFFTIEVVKLKSVAGIDDEITVGSLKHLSSSVIAENGSGNVWDVYTLEYTFESGSSTTGSMLSPGGWFTAGNTTGMEILKVSVSSPRTGKTFTDTFEVFIKEGASEETVYETAFSGNWMELTAALSYAGGNGTETDPYLISSVRQLKKLATDIVMLGATDATYRKYFQLTADLDFEGATVPNYLISSFQGTFDGHGHIIKNLTQHITNNSSGGIFSSIGYAVLKNLGRTGGSITGNGYGIGGLVRGGVSGSLISNCYNATPITGMRGCGGIVCDMNGTIENSYNIAPVEATDASYTYTGGLVGSFSQNAGLTVINSYNFGDVTGNSQYVGGLIAGANSYPVSAPVVIRNSFNFGTVKNNANNDLVGAILGYIANEMYRDFSFFNVRTRPNVVYKNGLTLVEPDRMIGYSSGANKINAQAIETANASQMSADAKYSLDYSRSPAFAAELGDAFKHAPGRTPKLAWEE